MKQGVVAANLAFEADVGFPCFARHQAQMRLDRFAECRFAVGAIGFGYATVAVAERWSAAEAIGTAVVTLVAAIAIVRARAGARAVPRATLIDMAQRVLAARRARRAVVASGSQPCPDLLACGVRCG